MNIANTMGAGCVLLAGALLVGGVHADCRDNVVMVHGNNGYPSDFLNTYNELRGRGYSDTQLFLPLWGDHACYGTCNDHYGSEETPVRSALSAALAQSCTGKIDVIGHSMGATLAAKEIANLGIAAQVRNFVGIAGAFRGLWSCGVYPYNVANATCGYWGLSIGSPFLNWLYGRRFGVRVVSIKSYTDEVICATGTCTVGGVHSSSIWNEDASYTFNGYGHYGLLWYTSSLQADLIQ